ncbi:MAG: sulfate permease [Campylobacterales bacterium]
MLEKLHTRLSPALLESLQEGYSRSLFVRDALAGLTVAIVALPLAMAIAIASNMPPERGIYTAIVAGFLISALGGSRYQIGGPTAAFIVTVSLVAARHGYEGLVLATVMAGAMLIVFAFLGAGKLLKFIPYPVITGFTSGIALLIFFTQIKEFLGLTYSGTAIDFLHRFQAYLGALHTTNPWALIVGLVSIGIIVATQRLVPRIPGPIVVVIISSLAVWAFDIPVETIEERFGALPVSLPIPTWSEFTFEKARIVFPDAVTIAVLAGLESLLSAVVADGMTGSRHKSDAELFGQGVANIASGLFGGIPATGAIARTATNIRSGAKTPVAGMMHAVWLLLFLLLFAPLIVKVPLAALSAILMVVAWNMSEIKHVRKIWKAPREDRAVLLTTFVLTVLVDLNFAVQVGIAMAALLFINKLMQSTQIEDLVAVQDDPDATSRKEIPDGVEVYELSGPLFFGVANKLLDTLRLLEKPPRVFILRMRHVPIVDAAGLHTLEEMARHCKRDGTVLILSGVRPEVRRFLSKSGLERMLGAENIVGHIDDALRRAREIL